MEKQLYNSCRGEYNFIMAYPSKEEFALSSCGYMWLYKIADTTEGINAIRISTDNISCKKNIKDIGAIGFSMSFDFDFIGVLKILETLNIPFLSKDRDEKFPVIFAGGPVITTNPEPYKQIFDFMMIGDGEESFQKVLSILKKSMNKPETICELQSVEGIYTGENKVKKNTAALNQVIYTPILSDNSYFKNTFIMEVSRGCMNRCAFCTASYLNLPYRYYEYEKIIETIELGLKYTNKLALLGAQISAHPQFSEIMKYIRTKIEKGENIELQVSSLRADACTPEIVQTLVMGGQKHSTVAIEAASERLRKFINKNLKEEQIVETVRTARENGLKGLKIYSMIGLPNETKEDIDEFMRLGKLLKSENKGFELEFSFSTFVPKPHTPFERTKREDTKSLEQKQKYLEKELRKLGTGAKFSSAKWDYWQTVLSRGDSRLTPLIILAYKKGGTLGAYKSASKELNINPNDYTEEIPDSSPLPWDNIEILSDNEILKKEYQRLKNKI